MSDSKPYKFYKLVATPSVVVLGKDPEVTVEGEEKGTYRIAFEIDRHFLETNDELLIRVKTRKKKEEDEEIPAEADFEVGITLILAMSRNEY